MHPGDYSRAFVATEHRMREAEAREDGGVPTVCGYCGREIPDRMDEEYHVTIGCPRIDWDLDERLANPEEGDE